MTTFTRKLGPAVVALVLLTAGSQAFAGNVGGIGYSPVGFGPASVPTLSEWMLMLVALLLAVMAWRALRAGSKGKPLASVVLAGALTLGALMSGKPLIGEALAVVGFQFTNPAGGFVTINQAGESPVSNATAVPISVNSVVPPPGTTAQLPVGSPRCVPGLTVAPEGTCYVNFVPLVPPPPPPPPVG